MARKSYKERFKNEDGVWRTIGGRRVFIRTGQSLSDAMKESGKFEKASDIKREEYQYKKDKLERERQAENSRKYIGKEKRTEEGQEAFNKYAELHDRTYVRENPQEEDTTYDLVGQHINKEQQLESVSKEAKSMLMNKYNMSETEADRQINIMKDTKARWEEDSLKRMQHDVRNNVYVHDDGYAEDVPKSLKQLQHERAKEQSKIDRNEFSNNAERNEIQKRITEYDKAILEKNTGRTDYKKLRNEFYDNMEKNSGKPTWEAEKEVQKYADKTGMSYEDADNDLRKNYREYTENGKEYDPFKGTPYERKYDSVMDRYEKDESFRNMLANERQKTIDATRKEVSSYFDLSQKERDEIGDQNDLYKLINDNYYNIDREDFDKIYDEEKRKTGFTQHIDMHGGTQEYSKEELKQMEDAGIRPMEHSYTGGGWEGVNSRKNLSTSEQAKAITDTIKEKYPDVKISRRSDIYSMGSSIDFNVMSSVKDLYVSDKDIDKMTDFGRLSVSNGFTQWAEKNVEGFKRYTNDTYSQDDVRRYAKEALRDIKSHEDQNVRGDEWYLSDYGKKFISDLNKEANSYTYSDSDGMVDYFDHGTYMTVSIGKWNKPYQVSTSDSDYKKLYQQYKKEHKGSNISLDEFKKWYK